MHLNYTLVHLRDVVHRFSPSKRTFTEQSLEPVMTDFPGDTQMQFTESVWPIKSRRMALVVNDQPREVPSVEAEIKSCCAPGINSRHCKVHTTHPNRPSEAQKVRTPLVRAHSALIGPSCPRKSRSARPLSSSHERM